WGVPLPPGRRVPGAQRAVVAGGNEGLAVWREQGVLHEVLVPHQPPHFLARRPVPQSDQLVLAPGRRPASGGRERQRGDAAVQGTELPQLPAGGRVPQENLLVFPPPGRQQLTVRGERQAEGPTRVAGKLAEAPAGYHVAE